MNNREGTGSFKRRNTARPDIKKGVCMHRASRTVTRCSRELVLARVGGVYQHTTRCSRELVLARVGGVYQRTDGEELVVVPLHAKVFGDLLELFFGVVRGQEVARLCPTPPKQLAVLGEDDAVCTCAQGTSRPPQPGNNNWTCVCLKDARA